MGGLDLRLQSNLLRFLIDLNAMPRRVLIYRGVSSDIFLAWKLPTWIRRVWGRFLAFCDTCVFHGFKAVIVVVPAQWALTSDMLLLAELVLGAALLRCSIVGASYEIFHLARFRSGINWIVMRVPVWGDLVLCLGILRQLSLIPFLEDFLFVCHDVDVIDEEWLNHKALHCHPLKSGVWVETQIGTILQVHFVLIHGYDEKEVTRSEHEHVNTLRPDRLLDLLLVLPCNDKDQKNRIILKAAQYEFGWNDEDGFGEDPFFAEI